VREYLIFLNSFCIINLVKQKSTGDNYAVFLLDRYPLGGIYLDYENK